MVNSKVGHTLVEFCSKYFVLRNFIPFLIPSGDKSMFAFDCSDEKIQSRMEMFSQRNTFLMGYVDFVWKSPFIPKLNVKSKLSNEIGHVINCTENFRTSFLTNIHLIC